MAGYSSEKSALLQVGGVRVNYMWVPRGTPVMMEFTISGQKAGSQHGVEEHIEHGLHLYRHVSGRSLPLPPLTLLPT